MMNLSVLLAFLVYTLFFANDLIIGIFGVNASSGQNSSSIGVLPSTDFPTGEAINLPLEGSTEAHADCGWIIAAAGSTSPGFYTLPNFGSFNLGAGNIGQSNVGFNNIGFGNYGQSNIGRLNTGYWNIGYLNDGFNNTGALNTGTGSIGDQNSQVNTNAGNNICIGYNNTSCNSVIGSLTASSSNAVGSNLQGSYLFGFNSQGQNLIGNENTGSNSVGVGNSGGIASGAIGTVNEGEAVVGSGNVGTLLIGVDNEANEAIGIGNTADFTIGAFNNGTALATLSNLTIGFNQSGLNDIGAFNTINDFTGYNNTVTSYVDTSYIPLNEPIIFVPTASNVLANIGTNYNNPANINEQAKTASTAPFIRRITSTWYFNLEFRAVLSVVDLGCPGDLIAVLETKCPEIEMKPLLVTQLAQPLALGTTCMGLNDPETALADPVYSRGLITLDKGFHLLSFDVAAVSPIATPGTGGTSLAFRLDYIRPSSDRCVECEAPIPPLFGFPDEALIGDPPKFELPEDIMMPPYKNCEVIKAKPSPELGKTCNPWCKSKHFKILKGTRLTFKQAAAICVDGLATASTKLLKEELMELTKKCAGEERFWIDGTENGCTSIDKNGRIEKNQNEQCETLRPFICNRTN